jgi:hypothetical protein
MNFANPFYRPLNGIFLPWGPTVWARTLGAWTYLHRGTAAVD